MVSYVALVMGPLDSDGVGSMGANFVYGLEWLCKDSRFGVHIGGPSYGLQTYGPRVWALTFFKGI